MTEKLEYSAADMASAAAGGWRDGQKAAAEAAQPAPAGEREACSECNGLGFGPFGGCGECCGSGQSCAAQQRTQAAGVPEGWRDGYRAAMNSAGWGVRELYVKHQHHDRVDGLLNRCKELEQSFIREADAMLAAAPAQPAAPAQGQQVTPSVSAMARVLSDRSADACNIDRDDNWAMYGHEYIEDVEAMLAAATAQGGDV